jgi:hypothetical protein
MNPGGATIADMPLDMAYAVPTNQDWCAINDNIFVKHLQKTHSKDETISPPKHMIIIWSNNVSYHVKDQLAALTMSAKYKFSTECFNYKVIAWGCAKGKQEVQRHLFEIAFCSCLLTTQMFQIKRQTDQWGAYKW